MMTDKVLQLINGMSVGKKKYETKKALKLGFATLEEYVRDKVNGQHTVRDARINVNIDKVLETIKSVKKEEEWQSTKDGKQFLNCNYFKTNDTNISKEMLEWFLKGIGNLSPFDLEIGKDDDTSNFDDMGITLKYIEVCMDFLLGKFIIKRNDKKFFKKHKSETLFVNTSDLRDIHFQRFAELEHLITNNEMFWLLFETVYTARSGWVTDEIFERYNRLSVPIERRIQAGELLNGYLAEDKESHFVPNQFNEKRDFHFTHHFTNYLSTIKDDEKIVIYRSFKVEKGKKIRKGVTMDSLDSDIHYAGSGFSYTGTKTLAHKLACFITSHLIRKYKGVNKKRSEEILEKYWISEAMMKNPTFFDDFYTCIGSFEVNKKDILFLTEHMNENEVIVSPKNVRLLDYRFLNIIDTIAWNTVSGFIQYYVGIQMTGNNKKFVGIESPSQILNIDGIYDFFWAMTKKRLQKQPNYPKSIINKNRDKWVMKHLVYCIEEFYELLTKYGINHDIGISEFTSQSSRKYVEILLGGKDGYAFSKMNGNSIRQRYSFPKSLMTAPSFSASLDENNKVEFDTSNR